MDLHGIWVAWCGYVKFIHKLQDEKDIQVYIYDRYCMELYAEYYDHEPKEFYKWFVAGVIKDKF